MVVRIYTLLRVPCEENNCSFEHFTCFTWLTSCIRCIFTEEDDPSDPKCIYFCGNSLGLQPRNTRKYIEYYLRTWATKGVTGHFVPHEDQLLPPFVDVDEAGSGLIAPVVGALQSEVAVMGTLTTNIHLLMASFYRPTKDKYRIIIEGKAFPSDHVSSLG